MNRAKGGAAVLCRAQQVNLLLSERGLSLQPPLSLLSFWMLVSNQEAACGSRLDTVTSLVAAQE